MPLKTTNRDGGGSDMPGGDVPIDAEGNSPPISATTRGGTAQTMEGGAGDDTFKVDHADDRVIEKEGEGHDTVRSSITHTLAANVEDLILLGDKNIDAGGNELNNLLVGNDGNNMLFGYAGQDTLDGGKGADSMWGGEGDDHYIVDDAGDKVFEVKDHGYDVVHASVDYTLSDHVEVLSLDGGNAVFGTGNALENKIFGNAGNNVLDGGAGADELSGLGGNDTFVFRAGEANGDRVYEFDGNGTGDGDKLELHGYGTAADGAKIEWVSGDTWLITSADGTIQEAIHLVGGPNLDATDYVFV